jgi:hypothetical protein
VLVSSGVPDVSRDKGTQRSQPIAAGAA